MNTIRRTDPKHRVTPIDGGQRPRVRPGGRRELPEDREQLPVGPQDGPDFDEELARQEEENSRRPVLQEDESQVMTMPEDRLDIHGAAPVPVVAEDAAEEESDHRLRPAIQKDGLPEAGRHLDLRA